MENLVIKVKQNWANSYVQIGTVLRGKIQESMMDCCPRCEITCLYAPAVSNKRFLQISANNFTKFNGIIDDYEHIHTENGMVTKIYARGYASILMDTMAEPLISSNINLDNFFTRYCVTLNNLGIPGVRRASLPAVSYFSIPLGCSVWEAFQVYGMRMYNLLPVMDDDMYINLDAGRSILTHTVNTQSGHTVTKAAYRKANKNIIKAAYIPNSSGTFTVKIQNPAATSGGKIVYLKANDRWMLDNNRYVRELIAKSTWFYNSWKLTLHGDYDIKLFDRFNYSDTLGNSGAFIVGAYEHVIDERQSVSNITLTYAPAFTV